MTSYKVHFDRIGRTRQPEPLTTTAESPDALAAMIYDYAGHYLRSRDVEVDVDMNTGKGFILAGFQTVSEFTIETRC